MIPRPALNEANAYPDAWLTTGKVLRSHLNQAPGSPSKMERWVAISTMAFPLKLPGAPPKKSGSLGPNRGPAAHRLDDTGPSLTYISSTVSTENLTNSQDPWEYEMWWMIWSANAWGTLESALKSWSALKPTPTGDRISWVFQSAKWVPGTTEIILRFSGGMLGTVQRVSAPWGLIQSAELLPHTPKQTSHVPQPAAQSQSSTAWTQSLTRSFLKMLPTASGTDPSTERNPNMPCWWADLWAILSASSGDFI